MQKSANKTNLIGHQWNNDVKLFFSTGLVAIAAALVHACLLGIFTVFIIPFGSEGHCAFLQPDLGDLAYMWTAGSRSHKRDLQIGPQRSHRQTLLLQVSVAPSHVCINVPATVFGTLFQGRLWHLCPTCLFGSVMARDTTLPLRQRCVSWGCFVRRMFAKSARKPRYI